MQPDRSPANVTGKCLSDHPDLALFVATLFQRLGGSLAIDDAGCRRTARPDPRHLRQLPQLAEARAHERFQSAAEWEGAMKLAEYWLDRLSGADREYVFTLLATAEIDTGIRFDFRDRL